ncbi:hypothetical protein GGP41_008985 [Bipolaris sorokiniana]|uniref:SWIM-type domain-containing protein n=2 Tax=Cochliobolus sativus TaxID=45130 RepID=A0A8H5ZCE4_COCSA|nr:uncharacterized protein COCSADRAFT_246418 [Bipolaris sorokiniana ND90Pr]EMD59880.1 hypothetical protein COCSADRAFT_246418 [Bipolaris sorokiniana ND90Pr]KAF5847718.1 hypothetical protein GGP41_008985 [Bipolaris sorokiniana]
MSLPKLPTNRRFLTRLFNSLAPPPAPSSPDAAASLTDDDKHHPNPLDSVPPAVKKQLLSLQVLFPTEFVPALDVLDRCLVTRFRIRNHPSSPSVHRQDGHHHEDAAMRLGGDDDDDDDEEMHMSDDAKNKDATRTFTTKHTSTPHEEATSIPIHVTTTTSAYDNITKSTIYYVQSAQHHRSSRYSTSSSSDQTPTYQVRLTTWSCSCPAFTFAAFPATTESPSIPLANHDNDDDDNDENNDTVQDHAWIFGGATLGDDMPPVCKHLLACLLAEKCNILFGRFVNERWITVDEAAGWAAGWGD